MPTDTHSPGNGRPDLLATLLAGGAIGTVIAILAGVVIFPAAIGPLAYVAIVAVGSVAGAALGVLAAVSRRRWQDLPGSASDGPGNAVDPRS